MIWNAWSNGILVNNVLNICLHALILTKSCICLAEWDCVWKTMPPCLENLLPQPVFDLDNQWNGWLVACKQCNNTYLIPPFPVSLRQSIVKCGEDNHTCSTLFPSYEKVFVEYIFICINLRKVCRPMFMFIWYVYFWVLNPLFVL